ncbi:MAG TPA: heavy metal-responsive transcriptional regulator [Candidatus Eisenbacteria bacterium]|nr:heavy metal-responsive transcriptional regulator [Candidatus Eisenbacteria bacterium]
MRSGELARLTGISTDTLRHYERLELLPKPPRTSGGYRDYPPDALERVRLIRRAMSVGFSLPELTTILKMRDGGVPPCRRVQAIAESKLQQVKHQIQDLTEMRDHLDALLRDWKVKLARTRKGEPARLLETVPREFTRAGLRSPLTKKRQEEPPHVNGCGPNRSFNGRLSTWVKPRQF